jgi:hypothetical protein
MPLSSASSASPTSCVAAQIGSEERAPDDGEGECRHVRLHVDGAPLGPGPFMCLGQRDHVRGVPRDAIAMEGGLHEASVAQVHVAFAREQAVAEHRLGSLQAAPLHGLAAVVDEDLDDGSGIGEDVGVLTDEPHMRHDRIGALELHHERRCSTAGGHAAQGAQRRGARGSRDIPTAVRGDRHIRVRDALLGQARGCLDVGLDDGHPSSLAGIPH